MNEPTKRNSDQISYKYFHWGPFLFHTTITQDECQMILKEGKKIRKKPHDFRHNLAGHLSEEYRFTEPENLWRWLQKYLRVYVAGYNDKWGRKCYKMPTNYTLTPASLWINYMKAGDFNPPHHHTGDISFVLYPHMPKEIIKENKRHKGTMEGPGGIAWLYGEQIQEAYINVVTHLPETGDLFIFPASLRHWVFPFKSKVERVSVSGNIFMNKKKEG